MIFRVFYVAQRHPIAQIAERSCKGSKNSSKMQKNSPKSYFYALFFLILSLFGFFLHM